MVAGAYTGRSSLYRRCTVAGPRVCSGLVLAGVVLCVVAVIHRGGPSIPALTLWLGATLALLLGLRSVGLRILGSVRPQQVAVVGHGPELPAHLTARLAGTPEVEIVATLCVPRTSGTSWPDQLQTLVHTGRMDRVVIDRDVPRGALVAMRALPKSVDITVVQDSDWMPGRRFLIEDLNGLSVVHAPSRPGPCSDLLKRAFDVCASACCLVLVAPFLAVVAMAIRRTTPGPALFRQRRTGRCGQPFTMLKLRTMREDAADMRQSLMRFNQAEPPLFKLEPDPRSTSLGRHLRRTHVDELPQLLNVLRGHMSLVGPRPLPVEEAVELARIAPSRHDVRPGITGPWQVSGGTALGTEELCRLDESYVAAHSFAEDLGILARTPAQLLRAPGSHRRSPPSPAFPEAAASPQSPPLR
jgi:lipopolysaccharide/colanic/teichoic acid biosynthesis glycosyltransferase